MLATHKNTIAIDLLEIIAEFEIPFKKYKPVKPLRAGDHVHNFSLVKENFNKQQIFKASGTNNSAAFRHFTGRPLVIFFYTSIWKERGGHHLQQLNKLQQEIKLAGANLLIITPDEAGKAIDEFIWNNSLSLNFYFDPENIIAGQFKVYSESDPAWNKYPGIDTNVPLLSTFVIDHTNQIVFDHIDYSLEQYASPVEILDAVADSVNGLKKRSA